MSRFGIYLCGVLGVFMIINVVCNAFHGSFVVVVVVQILIEFDVFIALLMLLI